MRSVYAVVREVCSCSRGEVQARWAEDGSLSLLCSGGLYLTPGYLDLIALVTSRCEVTAYSLLLSGGVLFSSQVSRSVV